VIDVMSKLGDVKVKTAEALRASEADDGASVVLVAVVREFDSKADKANRMADGDCSARDAIIELEQAGDSAKAAAEADPDLGEAARDAVLDAHLAICILKTEIFLAGGFFSGFGVIDGQAQILSYAVLFGFAQQIVTQAADQRAKRFISDLPTKSRDSSLNDDRSTG
jgi:hypothetical protein